MPEAPLDHLKPILTSYLETHTSELPEWRKECIESLLVATTATALDLFNAGVDEILTEAQAQSATEQFESR